MLCFEKKKKTMLSKKTKGKEKGQNHVSNPSHAELYSFIKYPSPLCVW